MRKSGRDDNLSSYMDEALQISSPDLRIPPVPSASPPSVPAIPPLSNSGQPGSPQSPRSPVELRSRPSTSSRHSQGSGKIPGYIPQKDPYNQTGASKHVRKITDQNGNVVTHVIKKGVEDFDFGEELGAGSYSTVVAATDKQTLRQYAIKILNKTHIIREGKVKYVEIEKHTLNRLGEHPGIIHLYYTFQDRASLFFVLDFAPNGELLHLIKRVGSLDIPCSRYYTAQLLDAVEFMHKHGVIHRDLKPENILLDYKMCIKITDFGTAKLLERNEEGTFPPDCRCNSFVGTAEYVSPELLTQKYQGKSADVWAIGCILYQMIAGLPPFQGSTQYLTFQRITQYQYKVPPGFPYLVRDLLKGVLVGPRRRMTIAQIKGHPLFEGVDWSLKALWGSKPPKIQPYRPTPSTMGPPGGSHNPHVRRAQQPSQPPTMNSKQIPRYTSNSAPKSMGGNKSLGGTSSQQPVPPTPQQPTAAQLSAQPPMYTQPSRRQPQNARTAQGSGQGAAAAAAALSRRPAGGFSSVYQQGQERINALKQQVAERQAERPTNNRSVSESYHRTKATSSDNLRKRYISQQASAAIAADAPRPQTPKADQDQSVPSNVISSPQSGESVRRLPTPPSTTLEQEWAHVLMSRSERILKIDKADIGTISSAEGEYDTESKFIRLFSSKKKGRIVILTTLGRLVLMNEDRKVKGEAHVATPQTRVRRIQRQKSGPMIIIDNYSRTFTMENLNDIDSWLDNIDLAKRYYDQIQAEAERNARGAATAAAIAVAAKR